MKKRSLIIISLLVLLALPAAAVLKEESLKETLRVLKTELLKTVVGLERTASSQKRLEEQHQKLLNLIERSNELSVIMYSQQQGNTFELTYALNSATKQYEEFQTQKLPYEEIINSVQLEYNRYRRLSQALGKIPPVKEDLELPVITITDSSGVVLDSILLSLPSFAVGDTTLIMDQETAILRDTCLIMSDRIVSFYSDLIQNINDDNSSYEETDALLKEAYDYAQDRYQIVQKQVFLQGSRDYFHVLKQFGRYFTRAMRDLGAKYGRQTLSTESYWKGPIVWLFAFVMLIMLVLAIVLANLITRLTIRWVPWFRTPAFQENKGMIITLTGIILFTIFCFTGFNSSVESFVSMASRIMAEFAFLLGTIFLSIFIRLDRQERRHAVSVYLPLIILAFLVIFLRIIFIPDSALNLIFPPVVLLFAIWQMVVNIRRGASLPNADRSLLWISAAVMIISTVVSWSGLVMMALLLLIWWFFQLMLLQLLVAVSVMITRHYKNTIKERNLTYRKKHPYLPLSSEPGAFIEVTWAYDLAKKMLLPILGIWSLPVAVNLACRVFNLNNVASKFFMNPFLHVDKVVNLSLFKLLLVVSLFFVFRYLVYAIKAFFKVWRTKAVLNKMKDPALFKESDINFNLANNIISLAGWGIYVIAALVMLEIPTSALTIVATGFTTGVGFAMKDVLNNFFYGVQLMGGRVRVGDTIECDGIRGKVESLSYQSTQVASEDGSIIAFTNTALFNKNFKNLTRNHQYEMINFTVGVKYGTDVEKARQVIREALEPLLVKDKYGRDLVDMKRGIAIRLRNFGDSSIDIQVLLFAAVEVHYSFAASAKEAIYNAFNANGIEIPFPQRDVYIKEAPKAE